MTDLSGVSAQAILCPRDHWKLLLFPSLDGILVLMKSLPSGEGETWFSHNLKWPYHVAAATYRFYIAEVKVCDHGIGQQG